MTGQPFFLHQTKKAYFSVLSGSYGEHIGSLLEDTDPKCSYSHYILPELQYLRDVLEGKPDIEDDIRKNTMTMGDCCALSFFEYGLSMKKDHQKDNFYDKELTDELEYIYSVNEGLFFLTNEVFLLKERESDAHCPITVRFVQTEDYFWLRKERKGEQTLGRQNKRRGRQKERPRPVLEYTFHQTR